MSLLAEWRLTRDRRKRAATYIASLNHEVPSADVAWLAPLTSSPSETLAIREMRFALRAIVLIVSERDALDDRTASDVAHELAATIEAESRRDPEAGLAWAERWRAYTAALAARGLTDQPAVRLARVMLKGAGLLEPTQSDLTHATQFITSARSAANEALREAFGAASLPEDVRPSALGPIPR